MKTNIKDTKRIIADKKVLSIDIGMIYGFAYIKDNQMFWGYNDIHPTRFASQFSSVMQFRKHLFDINKQVGNLDAIFFEEVCGTKGQYAMQIYGMFIGVLLAFADEIECPIVKGFRVAAIKKHATEHGNASKAEMIAAANEKYSLGLNPGDEKDGNIADAIYILSLGLQEIYGISL